MDRALKERIIGAAVLVVFVVLVVPVFLDGPPGGEMTSTALTLPGQETQNVEQVILDRDRDEPVPAPEAAVGETRLRDVTTSRQEPTPEKPAEEAIEAAGEGPRDDPPPRQVAQAVPANTSTTGMWAVQLGSFSSKENAERLAADLRKQGFAAFLSQLGTSDGSLHRVRIGPQKDRDTAEAMAKRLGTAGHQGQVVPHP